VSDITRLAEQIRATSGPLRIAGGGSWLHAGGPWAPAAPLAVRHLRGVRAYTPGDLVVTVAAGTTLAELAATTAAHGQMLALDPYGTPDDTIGAVVATASPAPLALGDHRVRDLVLGVQVVTGDGVVMRAGGHVVKNVAGFDLVRLQTGAWGTLGVITEVSLRLHARPPVDQLMCAAVPHADTGALDDLLPAVLAQRAPLPMLLVSSPGEEPRLWARLSGNTSRVRALQARLQALPVGDVREAPNDETWRTLRATPPDAIVLRARTHRSDAVPFFRAARDAFDSATLSYDPAHGSLRLVIPSTGLASLERDLATWYRLAAARGALHTMTVVVDQGRTRSAPHHTPRTPLEAGVKYAFDARDVLNRLAELAPSTRAHPDA
jgi:glycolate oxidase FAD binding subunit